MSKKLCRCQCSPLNPFSNSDINLASRRYKKPFIEVIRSNADSLPLRANDTRNGISKLKTIADDYRSTSFPQGRRSLKRRRDYKKQNDSVKSRRRRKVSNRSEKSERSESGDDSSGSSDSSLLSTPRNTGRNVSSKLTRYTFYSVVNTGVAMDQGATASALCRSFLALYLQLDESSVNSNLLNAWEKAGQNITVLKGYNHKHLQYLAKEVRHLAIDSNTLYKTTGDARVMLVLSAFGREEDMEEAFDDLCYLH